MSIKLKTSKESIEFDITSQEFYCLMNCLNYTMSDLSDIQFEVSTGFSVENAEKFYENLISILKKIPEEEFDI
ncbi:MAG: hypothetical protein U0Z75_09070 [Deinococcaceae bacterium]